jgi:hypothetical protein
MYIDMNGVFVELLRQRNVHVCICMCILCVLPFSYFVCWLQGDLIEQMDAVHHEANQQAGGVREHIDSLNKKHFGDKNKLFRDKDQMEAHARKGVRNKLREKRQAKYRDEKMHQTRERNGDL